MPYPNAYMQRLEAYRVLNELEKSHNKWRNIAEEITGGKSIKYHDNMSLTIAEVLYSEALAATRGLKANSSKAMGLIQNMGSKLIGWQGIYLSALVNNECLEDLVVDVEGMSFIGYRLNKGRISINANSGDYIGLNAEGKAQMQNHAVISGSFGMSARGNATFVNYGYALSMGNYASEKSNFINNNRCRHIGYKGGGAIYINNEDADTMGDSGIDGIYLNKGRVYSLGPRTIGGLYINEGTGDVGHMGFQAIKGIFVPRKNPEISLFERASLSNVQLVGHVLNAMQPKRIEAPSNSWSRAEKSIQDAREIGALIRKSHPLN